MSPTSTLKNNLIAAKRLYADIQRSPAASPSHIAKLSTLLDSFDSAPDFAKIIFVGLIYSSEDAALIEALAAKCDKLDSLSPAKTLLNLCNQAKSAPLASASDCHTLLAPLLALPVHDKEQVLD
ncbi:MAG: hypothetical protein B7X06_02505, partial [Verrucomicrobia bacterium 21-51-4]